MTRRVGWLLTEIERQADGHMSDVARCELVAGSGRATWMRRFKPEWSWASMPIRRSCKQSRSSGPAQGIRQRPSEGSSPQGVPEHLERETGR